jgi:hypothetical protein
MSEEMRAGIEKDIKQKINRSMFALVGAKSWYSIEVESYPENRNMTNPFIRINK